MRKSNKTMAGYQILMLMSTIDHQFDPRADQIIREYLSQEAPFMLDLDDELEEIITLNETNVKEYFQDKVKDFYADSTPKEREELVEFSKTLIRADYKITMEETDLFKILLKTWAELDKN